MRHASYARRNASPLRLSTGLLLTLACCGCSSLNNDHDGAASPADGEGPARDVGTSPADVSPADVGASSTDAGLLPTSMVTGLTFAPVTAAYLNPPPPVYVVVTDASRAQDAYDATLALPVFSVGPHGWRSCPPDSGLSYQLAFSFSDGSSLTVTLEPSGCQVVQIPGSSSRMALGNNDYWNELAQDLGISEANIYPYVSPGFQSSNDPQQEWVSCTTDADCDADDRCGYLVSDGCAAKGVCMVSACTGANCAMGAPEVCGCTGQTIGPVWSQSSATSVVAVYTSAPASGKLGPCSGSGDASGGD